MRRALANGASRRNSSRREALLRALWLAVEQEELHIEKWTSDQAMEISICSFDGGMASCRRMATSEAMRRGQRTEPRRNPSALRTNRDNHSGAYCIRTSARGQQPIARQPVYPIGNAEADGATVYVHGLLRMCLKYCKFSPVRLAVPCH